MKCEICSKAIATAFLGKLKGTFVRDATGKLHSVCFECQSRLKDKQSLLQQLK